MPRHKLGRGTSNVLDVHVVAPLLAALEEGNLWLQVHALEALGTVGDPEIAPQLRQQWAAAIETSLIFEFRRSPEMPIYVEQRED